MSKYFQIVVVMLYVLITIFAFQAVLVSSGLKYPLYIQWLVVPGWVFCCFGSAYIRAGVSMFMNSRYRRPLLAEEERLYPAIGELLAKAGSKREVRIWIDESREMNAYATGYHTIAISRQLMERLSPGELRGVLAHELGHLLSGDTAVAAAFATAGLLPQAVYGVYRLGAGFVRRVLLTVSAVETGRGAIRVNRVSILWAAVVLGCFGYLLYRAHLLKAVIPVMLFVLLFSVLNRVFRFLALMLSRLAEYRQDAFAFRLGYGDGLRRALGKLAVSGEVEVNRYFIMMHSTHPVIYNRIRKLEKLLRMRQIA
jgi:Zn-dependent protease with chaperone function